MIHLRSLQAQTAQLQGLGSKASGTLREKINRPQSSKVSEIYSSLTNPGIYIGFEVYLGEMSGCAYLSNFTRCAAGCTEGVVCAVCLKVYTQLWHYLMLREIGSLTACSMNSLLS